MEEKLKKILKGAKYESDSKLSISIWNTLIIREKRVILLKLWSLSFVGLASLGLLVPAFEMLFNDFAHSGFYEYFSLIFSDGGLMLSYWKELSLSLAESLPIMSIIYTLSLFFVCFLSFKYIIKQFAKEQSANTATLSLSI